MIADHELIADSFAGGGGASLGIEMALGRSPDIAINHDAIAIAVHAANHPNTRHYRENVWHVDPVEACAGRPVGLAWFSPDCRHFSRCKHGAKLSNKIRGLAWVATKWARRVRPRIIMLENVEEFLSWGPLDDDGRPMAKRAGETYKRWHRQLRNLGYAIETRTLVAADFGSPTLRKRFFLIARCDGMPIVWPRATHGVGCANPWRTTAEIIDWSLPTKSIFERRKSLAPPTLARIAAGVHRYVLGARDPFVVNGYAPTMIHSGNGERAGQSPRIYDINKPIGTIVAQGVKHALIACFLTKHYGGVVGHDLRRPIGAITAIDHHALTAASMSCGDHENEVRALLGLDEPKRTQTNLFDLIAPRQERTIYDIGHRMLSPRELFRGQGFPDSYIIDAVVDGKRIGAKHQVRLAGNSVCPDMAAALVRANVEQRAAVAA